MLKSMIWVVLGLAAVATGLHFQKEKELEELQKEYDGILTRSTEVNREIGLVKAKIELAQAENGSGADLEAKHNASVANIGAEQKKIEAIVAEWPSVESARYDAVKQVRDNEFKKPVYTLALPDGTQLESFAVRGVPDENTVSVEHANGLVKMPADKLPAELKSRLGLNWKPEPPAAMQIDREGNAVLKQATRETEEKAAADETAKELGLGNLDTTTMSGLTKSLAVVDAQLTKALVSLEAERANLRKLDMFKGNAISPVAGKNYATLKKESSQKMAALAGRVQRLRSERADLQHKMKSFN
ncbi:MAG: hypothetical protein JWL81_95 [Verrucomicrobiales bacterium]|nr:hypothetical protein [Verrucomicrobiales bacterium]